MTRRFNFIYEKLVQGEDDVVGLLAYGLYKKDKIEHIKRIKDKKGQDPNEEELEHFHESSEAHIENYRTRAIQLSRDFLQNVLVDRVAEIEAEHDQKLSAEVRNLKARWWPSIMQSFLGAILFAFCIGVAFFVIVGVRIGFWKTLETCGYFFTAPTHYEMTETKQQAPPAFTNATQPK